MLLLISPDSVEEAVDCAKAAEYLDIVDVKKPDEGSLGANFPWVIREIREAVPAGKPVSATVGDVPYKPGTVAQAALGAVVSGATYIKVGLYGCTTPDQGIDVMRAVVRAVKDYRPEALVVASGYADAHRVGCVNPLALPDIAARSGADAAMLDTAIKDGTRLFDHVPPEVCAEFVARTHAAGLLAALMRQRQAGRPPHADPYRHGHRGGARGGLRGRRPQCRPDPATSGGRVPGGDGPASPGARGRRHRRGLTAGSAAFDAVAANRVPGRAARFAVVDPATGEPFDEAPDMRPEELHAVVGRARRAWPGWRADPAARTHALLRAAEAVEAAA